MVKLRFIYSTSFSNVRKLLPQWNIGILSVEWSFPWMPFSVVSSHRYLSKLSAFRLTTTTKLMRLSVSEHQGNGLFNNTPNRNVRINGERERESRMQLELTIYAAEWQYKCFDRVLSHWCCFLFTLWWSRCWNRI